MSRFLRAFVQRLGGFAVSGALVLLAPVLTVLLINWLFTQALGLTGSAVEGLGLGGLPWIGGYLAPFLPIIHGLTALLIIVFVLIFAGWLYSQPWAARLLRLCEGLIAKIPVIGSVYISIRDMGTSIRTMMVTPQYQAVLRVAFPDVHTWVVGAVTNEVVIDRERFKCIVLLSTPVPWSGLTIMVPESKWATHLRPLNCSVDGALKFIMSAGTIADFDEKLHAPTGGEAAALEPQSSATKESPEEGNSEAQ